MAMIGGNASSRIGERVAGRPPRVTMVLPNRNHGRFLRESLGSIAAQARPPDEVIVIDDASDDDSIARIREFTAAHSGWQLMRRHSCQGVVASLNQGLEAATGDWIAFLGADDLVRPSFLARAAAMAAAHPGAGLVCGCVAIGDGHAAALRPVLLPRPGPAYVSPSGFRTLLAGADNFFLGTVTLYRRAALLALGGFDAELGSLCDGVLARRIAGRHGFGFLPEVLGVWRIHGDNYSVRTSTQAETLHRSIRRVRATLTAEPPGIFPRRYADLLDRRFRFGGARLLALDDRLPPGERASGIAALLHSRSSLERRTLRHVLSLGRHGTLAALVWITLRLHPFSLFRLLRAAPIRHRILTADRLGTAGRHPPAADPARMQASP